MHSASAVWMNGRLTDAAVARVSVMDHGLLYGDGVFEGIRFFARRAFRLGPHLERLERSAAALSLRIPYTRAELASAVGAVIAETTGDDGYVRLVVTRGEGDLGLDPSSCTRPTVFVLSAPLRVFDEASSSGIDVIVAATRQSSPDTLDARIKSLNYLNRLLARLEASRAGAAEALMLNAQGRLAEGTTDNLFIVRGGELQTPPAIDGALEGVTREAVLDVARALGICTRETSLSAYDLLASDEAFVCGTAAGLVPLRSVDGRPLRACPGQVFLRVAAAYDALVRRETSAPI